MPARLALIEFPADDAERARSFWSGLLDVSLAPRAAAQGEGWQSNEVAGQAGAPSAAAIAILLSCLGLFAIVTLVLEQRRKEIGVRKVLGASMMGITGLLSKDFLKLIVLAFVIAVPIGVYFLDQWLRNFIYRTSLSWWIFAVAGLVSVAIALLTIGVQTVRAALANPVESLRSE